MYLCACVLSLHIVQVVTNIINSFSPIERIPEEKKIPEKRRKFNGAFFLSLSGALPKRCHQTRGNTQGPKEKNENLEEQES